MFAIAAFICFLGELIGPDLGGLNLTVLGLMFLALQLAIGDSINIGALTRRRNN